MNEQEMKQSQQRPKTWRRPQLERLRVALDTENANRGSCIDFGCAATTDPEKLFGGS